MVPANRTPYFVLGDFPAGMTGGLQAQLHQWSAPLFFRQMISEDEFLQMSIFSSRSVGGVVVVIGLNIGLNRSLDPPKKFSS